LEWKSDFAAGRFAPEFKSSNDFREVIYGAFPPMGRDLP
jgi:hypothetical protein